LSLFFHYTCTAKEVLGGVEFPARVS
jgi:hypothetical protein